MLTHREHRGTGACLAAFLFAAQVSCEPSRGAPAQFQPPPAAAPSTPPGALPVTGRERIEWEQEGQSYDQINSYRYMAVVGLARRELLDVRCEARSPKGPFVCSGGLPPLQPGAQYVRIIALFRNDASPWSRPLLLFKQP